MQHTQPSEFLLGQHSQGAGGLPNTYRDSASEDHFVWSADEKPAEQTSTTKRTSAWNISVLFFFFQMQEIRYGKQCWCVWAGLDSYCCTTVCNKWCVFKNIYRWIMDACRYESDCCFVVVQFEGPEVDLILHIAACVEGIYMKLSSYLLYWAPYPSVWNCDLLCCDMIRNRATTHCNGFFQSPGNVCLA